MKKFKEQCNSSKNSKSDVWIRIMCKFWIISRSRSTKFFYI